MNRPMLLAMNGWYSSSKSSCKNDIQRHINNDIFLEGITPISAIVPHAGWYFCGNLAINTIRLMKEKNGDIKHIFVFGGHLGEMNLPVVETFDFAETPFGTLENNKEILSFILENFNIHPLPYHEDNTIEILLPIIKYFFGNVTITAIYLPPNQKVREIVEKLFDKFNYRALFIGSTDLTHYGPRYNFYHHDKSMKGIDWVRNVNDKKYINQLLSLQGEESLKYALANSSACSSGAAFASIVAAQKKNVTNGRLIGYSTSYDVSEDSSFVGYTGIIY